MKIIKNKFTLLIIGFAVLAFLIVSFVIWNFVVKDSDTGNADIPQKTAVENPQKPEKFTYFPVKLEDFVTPSKMYGLWPYGVKGNNKDSHNEGHPGWDFELKKESKLYAVSDLIIQQIHEGEEKEGTKLWVIEANAKLQKGDIHVVYHSVVNLEDYVKEGAFIKAGQVLAEAGYPLSEDSVMIHFGVFAPNDRVGSCPTSFFDDSLQETITKIVANSKDSKTNKPYESACVGKINKEIYLKNYPNAELGGGENWE